MYIVNFHKDRPNNKKNYLGLIDFIDVKPETVPLTLYDLGERISSV